MGMFGEQGAESIYTIFNQLERTYANMTNGVKRLKSMVSEHYRQICPDNIIQCPTPGKRKKTVEVTPGQRTQLYTFYTYMHHIGHAHTNS